MSDPATYEEYMQRFNENQSITGDSLDATIHACCPFCCAAGFQDYNILNVREEIIKESTCKECGRSAKVMLVTLDENGTSLELVQTGGDPPPPYLPPIRTEA